ncbi:RnfABCDGE type electron transport complex subunit D [Limisalsivibrio acetivorans]|uniref:RnfABCDGE type electron transport complex subunit D n=1 Tax=Limisalsivibrio acetivorans TaxID=1304888 RepID=UPI0003B36AFC|nr:RnfABCDGE type electron transport complex subunit D [Limisalsivibrio acetivorans]
MSQDKLLVTFSPHVRDRMTSDRIMLLVVLALVPSMLVSVYVYGFYAIKTYALTILFCLAFEAGFQKIRGTAITLGDNSALLTAILLAMNMPPNPPWWLLMVGSLVAIVISKQVFGGLGHNPFNPALVGRVFLLIAWPAQMTGWIEASTVKAGFAFDTVSAATPLGQVKAEVLTHGEIVSDNLAGMTDLLVGTVNGCLGGDSAIAVLIGGLFLIYKKIIRWHVPATYLGTVFVLTGIYWFFSPDKTLTPIQHLFAGGLMLGAFFMATDYVTSPMTPKGQIIFGVGCGVLTVVIRLFGGYPEGVAFSILIMNAFVPIIDNYMRPKSFGEAAA